MKNKILLYLLVLILLIFSFSVSVFAEEGISIPKGEALLVGLKSVDPMEYGTDGENGCWGCENDVALMNNILSANGFNVSKLLTQNATHDDILNHINQIKDTLYAGDTFIFYFAGHGDQKADSNGDELDGLDEALVAYDKEIIDDELDSIWKTFPIGVKIVMISDSCHSGTAYRPLKNQRAIVDLNTMDASLIHISGCRDDQFSNGDWDNGTFTKALRAVWNNGNFNGNYQTFCEQINSVINNPEQISEYYEYGNVFDNFRSEKPFTINKTVSQVSSFTYLKEGDQILFKCLGNIPGDRWLDGRTANATVGLVSSGGGEYTGSKWEAHKNSNGSYSFKCLGNISGNRWLDGRTTNATVGLSPYIGDTFTGANWEVIKNNDGSFSFKCLGNLDGCRWLDGRTSDSAVGLSSYAGGKYTGSYWSIYKFQ